MCGKPRGMIQSRSNNQHVDFQRSVKDINDITKDKNGETHGIKGIATLFLSQSRSVSLKSKISKPCLFILRKKIIGWFKMEINGEFPKINIK